MISSYNTIISKFNLSEGRLVILVVVGMVAVFAILIVFISGGAIRHVAIFWKEKVEATVAFRNFDGELKLVGIKGIIQGNPTYY